MITVNRQSSTDGTIKKYGCLHVITSIMLAALKRLTVNAQNVSTNSRLSVSTSLTNINYCYRIDPPNQKGEEGHGTKAQRLE